MTMRFPHEQKGQRKADRHERDTGIEGIGSQPLASGNPTGQERSASERTIPGELVETHREAAPRAADEIDLHDHRRGPREPLADTEERVRYQNPGPRGRPHQEERHGHRDDPANDEDLSAPDPI